MLFGKIDNMALHLFESLAIKKKVKVILFNDYEAYGVIYKMERKMRQGLEDTYWTIAKPSEPNITFSFWYSQILTVKEL